MRISDWSSDVCSSDLCVVDRSDAAGTSRNGQSAWHNRGKRAPMDHQQLFPGIGHRIVILRITLRPLWPQAGVVGHARTLSSFHARSEEHTSELQSLMRISYDVFCLKKKTHTHTPYDTQSSELTTIVKYRS